MKLFFDFDGTLIDSKSRLYNLFSSLVKESHLSFNEYWGLKKTGLGHAAMLQNIFGYSENEIENFQHKWHDLIEDDVWLKYDQPFDGATEKLKSLSEINDLYLVTARQNINKVNQQLDSFSWYHFFKQILVTEQKVEKQALILKNVEINSNDWIIGDTGKDIQVGKALGMNTCGVLSGFRSEENLKKYQPDIILNSFINFNEK